MAWLTSWPGRHAALAAALIVTAWAVAAGFAAIGTPAGHSYDLNLAWFAAFDAQWNAGELYPRRLASLWSGFGGNDFFFYGPMPFWIASVSGDLLCSGCDVGARFAASAGLILVLSSIAFYALARRYLAPRAAGFAAAVYAILPYHLLADWFARQAVGEFTAYLFLPLLGLGYLKLVETRRGGLLFALALAGLVFSHLPTVLIAGQLLALAFALQLWTLRHRWRSALALTVRLGAWTSLGFALSAIYWVPAVALLDDVSSHFLFDHAFQRPSNWLFFDGRPEPQSVPALKMTLICGLAVSLAGASVARLQSRALAAAILLPALFCLFLVSPLSWPLWQVSLLETIQFPWRSFVLLDIATALAAGAFAAALTDVRKLAATEVRRLTLASAAAGAALILSYPLFMTTAVANIRSAAERSGDYARIGALEYLPATVYHRFDEEIRRLEDPSLSQLERVHRRLYPDSTMREGVALNSEGGRRYRLVVENRAAGPLDLPLFHWSHWQADDAASGAPLALTAHPERGTMQLAVPPSGEAVLSLPILASERIGLWLSGAGLIVFILLLSARLMAPRRASAPRPLPAAN